MKILALLILCFALCAAKRKKDPVPISKPCQPDEVTNCMGSSTWVLKDAGGLAGYDISFNFLSYTGYFSCEHLLKITSECSQVRVNYQTKDQCMECPVINFPGFAQFSTLLGCDMQHYRVDFEILSLFQTGDSAEYCINKSGGLLYDELVFDVLGGQVLTWVSGAREIWFW